MKRGDACPACGQTAQSRRVLPIAAAALLLGLVACEEGGGNAVALYGVPVTDADGDGYSSDVDCNDDDATIHPDATEIAGDDIDQDCDGDNEPAT